MLKTMMCLTASALAITGCSLAPTNDEPMIGHMTFNDLNQRILAIGRRCSEPGGDQSCDQMDKEILYMRPILTDRTPLCTVEIAKYLAAEVPCAFRNQYTAFYFGNNGPADKYIFDRRSLGYIGYLFSKVGEPCEENGFDFLIPTTETHAGNQALVAGIDDDGIVKTATLEVDRQVMTSKESHDVFGFPLDWQTHLTSQGVQIHGYWEDAILQLTGYQDIFCDACGFRVRFYFFRDSPEQLLYSIQSISGAAGKDIKLGREFKKTDEEYFTIDAPMLLKTQLSSNRFFQKMSRESGSMLYCLYNY